MPRLSHFEIDGENPDKLVDFYSKTFGWEFTKWDGPFDYWTIKTGKDDEPGINGGLMKREENQEVYNIIDVPSVDEYVKKIKENGGKIITPKRAIPTVGWIAYFKDSEGNCFGIMQEDETAR
jgi:predicted enzyme related to lactoylglutathione lyase